MKSTMTQEEMILRNERVAQDEERQRNRRMEGLDDKYFRGYRAQLQSLLDNNPDIPEVERNDIVEHMGIFDRAVAHDESLTEKEVRWAQHVLRHYQGIYAPRQT